MRKSSPLLTTATTVDIDHIFNVECVDIERLLNNQSNIIRATDSRNSSVNKILKRISKLNSDILTNYSNASDNSNNSNTEFDLSKESLFKLNYESARNNEINNELKKLLRLNKWSINHEIRKHLWQSLLLISEEDARSYYQHVQKLFGSSTNQTIEIDFPKFANLNDYSNFYYLNSTGRFKVKRILCVYGYHYPDVTFSPTIISVTSLLLHYMQEHEAYMAVCNLFIKRDYLVETKISSEASCLVFNKLLKIFCVSLSTCVCSSQIKFSF